MYILIEEQSATYYVAATGRTALISEAIKFNDYDAALNYSTNYYSPFAKVSII